MVNLEQAKISVSDDTKRVKMSPSTTIESQRAVASVSAFVPQPYQWVQLRDPLSTYSADQAYLLCEVQTGQWLAWVPNYGEARLHRHQLLRPTVS